MGPVSFRALGCVANEEYGLGPLGPVVFVAHAAVVRAFQPSVQVGESLRRSLSNRESSCRQLRGSHRSGFGVAPFLRPSLRRRLGWPSTAGRRSCQCAFGEGLLACSSWSLLASFDSLVVRRFRFSHFSKSSIEGHGHTVGANGFEVRPGLGRVEFRDPQPNQALNWTQQVLHTNSHPAVGSSPWLRRSRWPVGPVSFIRCAASEPDV